MSRTLSFQKPKPLQILRAALLLNLALAVPTLIQFRAQIIAEELVFTSIKFRAALWGSYVFVALGALLVILFWTTYSSRLLKWLADLEKGLGRVRLLALILFVLVLLVPPILVLGFYGRFLHNPFSRLFLFWILALVATSLLAAWRRQTWINNLPIVTVALVAVYLAATFFNLVRGYPFSLDWSEASRYYQASFYFSQKVYGVKLPLPVTHPSRYLLQSVPFLITSSPWVHRFWQALLWISMPLLTSWLMARRLQITGRGLRWLFVGWSFLFLLQGAVFYHLLPCVFLVLIGFDKNRPGRSFLFVAAASVWAGISRVNWFPLPGALAVLLYLLEARPMRGTKILSLQYLWPPLLYGLGGLLVALGADAFYITNSGVQDLSQFSSAFTSQLLWQRLLPNAAFPLGVLLGIALVSAPLLTVLWLRWRQGGNIFGFWRSLGIALVLAVFFFAGLVVSVKIGGGTNLHNLDAYMVLLWVLASAMAFAAFAPESGKPIPPLKIPWLLTTGLLIVPILFAVFSGAPLNLPNRQLADQTLAQIQQMTDEALQQGGEVLFISQRHLLTFHLVKNVPLVHEYEKLFLMEMAISGNTDYLSRFHQDIDTQRFSLIITDPLYRKLETTEEDVLAPENNAWVRSVSRSILCAYEPVATFSEFQIQLLTPRYGSKCNQ